MTGYRADIDGLRAIAVLSVVFFHAGLTGFTGGFVGVDIFFVISGFLITSILIRDIEAGRFSLARFYQRRTKRIIPALVAVWIGVGCFGYFALLPKDLSDLGFSLATSALFISNLFFFADTGYFASASEYKPLLHTWSLSIEEQFYLVWPLALFAVWRWLPRRAGMAVVVVMVVASLAYAQIRVSGDPDAAFYLIPSRFWELGLGALLACFMIRHAPGPWVARYASAVGLTLIVGSIAFLDKSVPFPGVAAFPACAGAALVIYGGASSEGIAVRCLSWRPLVFIGLISYSLYLWHWPVFSYMHIVRGEVGIEGAVFGVLLSLALAVLSWRFIERPFRGDLLGRMASRTIIWGGAVPVMVAVLIASIVVDKSGMPERLPKEAVEYGKLVRGFDPIYEACQNKEEFAFDAHLVDCVFGARGDGIDFLVYGDSHAQHLVPGLNLQAREAGLTGGIIAEGGCPPMWRDELRMLSRGKVSQKCSRVRRAFHRALEEFESVKFVLIAARWDLYALNRSAKKGGSGVFLEGRRGRSTSVEVMENDLDALLTGLRKRGIKSALMGQVVPLGWPGQSCVRQALIHGGDLSACRPARVEVLQRLSGGRALGQRIARTNDDVVWIDPYDAMCSDLGCLTRWGSITGYRDDDHLNPRGSRALHEILSTDLLERLAND